MTTAEQQYFTLMRAALWQQPVELEETPDWEGIMSIAHHHATNVLVADVASRLTGDKAPSSAMLREMKTRMRANLINQLELKQILTKAIITLRDKGMEPVLLKGFGLALLYPNPNLRQFGDIDLFVGVQQFHSACTVLRTLPGGYNWGDELDIGRHYNIEFGHYPMEIHRVSADIDNPRNAAKFAVIEQDGLFDNKRTVNFEGFQLPVPSKEFMVFFTFFHAWHHFLTTGVGWRQISDVTMTLHTYLGQPVDSQTATFDLEKLHTWLMTMHLLKPWQTFGWLMVNYLGLPTAEMPFYNPSCSRKAQKLYTRVMAEGNFRRPNRFKHRKPKGRIAKRAHSFIGIFVDFFQLANLFPAQAFHEMQTALEFSFSKIFQKK